MKSSIVLFWTPRILSLLFVLFISLFSLDVFSEYSGTAIILPLLMHLLPSIMLLGLILAAWKYEFIGVIAFCGYALFYVWSVGLYKPVTWYLLIALPSFLVGVFYFISWKMKTR